MKHNLPRWLIATAALTICLVLCGIVTFPVSVPLFSAPYALEDALFGTAYLYNALPFGSDLILIPIPIGLLLLPLLGRSRWQALLLAGIAYIVLPVALFSFIGFLSFLSSRWPSETYGPVPKLLSDALPLEAAWSITTMKWSPDGRFIAIGADTNPDYYGFDGRQPIVILVDSETGQSIVQISEALYPVWASDNRLWVLSRNHWRSYAEPFAEAELIDLGYEREKDHPFDYKLWAFDPDTQTLAVAEPSEEPSEWHIHIWQGGTPTYQVELQPRNRAIDGGNRGLELSFSPTGTHLALVVSGWIAYEQPGPEELWLLEIAEGELKFLREGKTKAWKLWDYEVQDLNPYWSPDGKEIAVADYTFGVEKIAVESGRTRRILGWNSHVYDVGLSPSGEWMAFVRWPEKEEDDDLCLRCVGVLSMSGKHITYLPEAKVDWPYIWYDWHPRKNMLAVLTKQCKERYRLYLWDLSAFQG
jgi:hypothetical protein